MLEDDGRSAQRGTCPGNVPDKCTPSCHLASKCWRHVHLPQTAELRRRNLPNKRALQHSCLGRSAAFVKCAFAPALARFTKVVQILHLRHATAPALGAE